MPGNTPGSGCVYFRVTPNAGQDLHDVYIIFSPIKGVATENTTLGTKDADNIWSTIGGWGNKQPRVVRGRSRVTDFYYTVTTAGKQSGTNPLTLQLSVFPGLTAGSYLPAGTAYDFCVVLNAPAQQFIVMGRQAQANVLPNERPETYQEMYRYTLANAAAQGFAAGLPTNGNYFAFSSWDNNLVYSNISVGSAPVMW